MLSAPTCRTCSAPMTSLASGSGPFCTSCVLLLGVSDDGAALSTSSVNSFPRPFGDYELLAEVGHGGMGLVFKAHQPSLDRVVALKVLLTGRFSDESARRRFKLEAHSAAKLQHPNIVAIHEIGEADGHPFLTMDFIDGPNLTELCRGRPLPDRTAAQYIRDIALGVHAAHAAGVLHRDLKPSNILIGSDQRPRVTDFGLAKLRDTPDGPTVAGQVLGSPNYASPEQACGRNEQIGIASDVYGLGAILYHLVTGRAPFNAPTTPETLRLVLETEPPAPRLLNPALPRDLETICLKCLQKDSAQRYASAQEMADELDRFLAGSPIMARPVSGLELAWRWGRKHPAVPALVGTVVLALVVTSGVFYSSARRIDHARAKEMAARLAAEDDLYAATLQVIGSGGSALAGLDLNGARRLLRATRPSEGGRDLRGFEWRYYWLRSQGEAIAALRGHRHRVDRAFFSPDGSLITTRSVDGEMKLWDATSLRELHSIPGVARIGGFAAGSQRLIFSQKDNSIQQLDIASLRVSELGKNVGRLIGVQPDGRHAVFFGAKGVPFLRPLAANVVSEMPPDEGQGPAAVSADGATAAITRREKGKPRALIVVDLVNGKETGRLVDDRPVISLALSANGSQLASAGFDGVLKIWDVARGIQKHAFRAFLDPIWGMAFSPDGQTFAAAGANRELKMWSTSAWTEAPVVYPGHESTVKSLSFSPDGQWILSGADDDLALLWSTKPNRPLTEMRQLLRGPKWEDATPSLAFSPDSRLFAGTAADGTIKVWRADTAESVLSIPASVRRVAFSRDGKSIVSEDYDCTIRRWPIFGSHSVTSVLNSEPGAPGEAIVSKGGPFENWLLAKLSPEQRVALVADRRETPTQSGLYEISNARDAIFGGARDAAATIAMSPDGNTMFIGTPQGLVEVWDITSRTKRFSFTSHRVAISAIAVSGDGRYLATGSLDNLTKLFDAATGDLVATYQSHNRPVWALAFSPDGKTLAAGSCDKTIILCSVGLKRTVGTLALYVGLPAGFEQEVRLLRFSPDGNILAAALGDGTVRFFRAAPFSETDRGEN